MSAPVVDERRARNRALLVMTARWLATVLLIPALLVAVVAALATQRLLVGIIAAVLVYVALSVVVFGRIRSYGRDVLATLATAPADPQAHARLHNLADGLCVAHGVTKPVLLVLPTDACNAAGIVTGEREATLVVTTGLYDALERIELEGLLAQLLSRVRDGDTALATFVGALASLPVAGSFLGRKAAAALDPDGEIVADMAGASMTRYPPGLAGALEKLAGSPTVVDGVDPTWAHLWIADPRPGDDAELVPHRPLVDRAEVLREL